MGEVNHVVETTQPLQEVLDNRADVFNGEP